MGQGEIKWFDRSVTIVAKSTNPFRENWFVSENLKKLHSEKRTRIFVNGHCDLSEWKLPWAVETLSAVVANKKNTYLFLTNSPSAYEGWRLFEERNVWCGFRFTGDFYKRNAMIEMLKMEPHANWYLYLDLFDDPGDLTKELAVGIRWIIINASEEALIFSQHTLRERVNNILMQADIHHVPVFMEDSLKAFMRRNTLRKCFPNELQN